MEDRSAGQPVAVQPTAMQPSDTQPTVMQASDVRPSVSIIVPVYNESDHLRETVACIQAQTLTDWEAIFVDDGSTDDSFALLSELSVEDGRIQVISQPNSGASVARNAGIDRARGRFVAFLDADDVYGSSDYLESLYDAALAGNCQIAGGVLATYHGPGRISEDFDNVLYAGYAVGDGVVVDYRDYQFDYGFHRFIYDRSLFDEGANRFTPLSFYEDPIWLARIMNEAGRFAAAGRQQYWYRSDDKVVRWTTQKVLDLIRGVELNFEYSAQENLALLHWYTFIHFDDITHGIGVGLDRDIDVEQIERALSDLRSAINEDLLQLGVLKAQMLGLPGMDERTVAAEEPGTLPRKQGPWITLMEKKIRQAQAMGPVQLAAARAAQKARATLTPLYRRLRY